MSKKAMKDHSLEYMRQTWQERILLRKDFHNLNVLLSASINLVPVK